MGTRLPSTSEASSTLGPNAETMVYLQQKRAWQADRGVQGNKTANILRYATSGGASYYLIEPSYAQVSGLTSLLCYFDDEPKNYKRRFDVSIIESATCVFIFYDIPNGIDKQDVIVFDDEEYAILDSRTSDESGRVEVAAVLLKDS